jgi:hypothetical protein
MEASNSPRPVVDQPQTPDQGVMVVVGIEGHRWEKHLTVTRQALTIQDGKLVLVGPKKEEKVETFEWIGP